jgi:hypothetical protein
MTKKAYVILSMSIRAFALVAPLAAQSLRLTANIPFEFMVAGKTLPAGQYTMSNGSDPYVVILQGGDHRSGALTLTNHENVLRTNDPASVTRLEFNKYGDRYFLSEVIDGYREIGYTVPMTRAERELAKTASAEHFEVLATLARR